jgi:hypothetical protein
MRALVSIAVIGLLVAAVSAQTCTVAEPSVDPFEPSTCGGYVAADTTFCACVGVQSNNATACLRTVNASLNCTQVATCLVGYTNNLLKLESERTSTTAACNKTGTAMHNLVLAAAATTYAGSILQQSCRFRVCEVMQSFRLACSFGTNDTNVCQAPVATAAPTTTSAPTTAGFAIRATLRLSGTAYAALLNNATARAVLEAALKTDLAGLLGINSLFIRILNMTVGSLVVDFAILNGSGKTASQLNTGLAAATANTNWLSSTKSVYSTVSNETIGVLSLTVTEVTGSTDAPTTTTTSGGTTIAPPTTSNAAATSVLAAAALAVLALAL